MFLFTEKITIAALLTCFVVGCSAPSSNSGRSAPPKSNSDRVEAHPPERDESPSEEIASKAAPTVARDASVGDREIPEDPAELKKRAKEELAAGNVDGAMSMIDVLLVLDPNDLELIEIRGDIMMKQGLIEDATVDLKRCCKQGRQSCCR